MIFDVLIVLCLALFTRFVIAFNSPIDFDTYGHLYFAKEVLEQKSRPFGQITLNVVSPKPLRYPFLWHWIIGFLSFDFIYTHKRWLNGLLDTLFILIIYSLISVAYDSKTAYLVGLLYIFTPILYSGISTGPRIKSLTPRITSEIAVNLYFIVLLLPLPISQYVSTPLAALLGVYTLLSSKFGIQAIVLISIFISLFLFSYKLILVLLLSIVLSVLISRGLFLETLKEQASHLVWYFKKNLKGEMSISNRNSLNLIKEKSKDENGILKIGTILLHLIRTNSFGVVIFKMPVLVVGLSIFICFNFFTLEAESIMPEIYIPVLAGVIIYVIVNIPILLFIGEAERYLNHVMVFILLLTTVLAFELNVTWVLWTLIGYGLLYWLLETFVYNTIVYKKLDRDIKEEEEKEIIDFLKSINKEKTILSFPYHAVGIWRIMLETIHKTVYPLNVTKKFAENFEANYDVGYPYVDLNKINEMNNDFGLDILIINNKQVRNRYGKNWTPSDNWIKEPISGEIYTVYRNTHK